MTPLIVFSDLDGTLLDHDSYDWSPARPMLEHLTQIGVPVILASSKTAAEMIPLRAAMGLGPVPMICENGAGLVTGEEIPEADDYARLRALLTDLDAPFLGFGDMGTAGIAQATGLPLAQAVLAGQRGFSEPGLWQGSVPERDQFIADLARHGVAARMGGRFLTLSFGATKADRMGQILNRYGHPVSIALGDAPNDLEMLAHADHGIIIANPHSPPLPPQPGEPTGRIRRSLLPGPDGWADSLSALLKDLNHD